MDEAIYLNETEARCDLTSIYLSAVFVCTSLQRKSKITDALPFSDPESDPNHSKQVNYEGVKKILEAAKLSTTCTRIIRITGDGEHPFGIFSILINLLGSFAKAWNYEGEQVMRSNPDIDYTIIRPGIMKQADKLSPNSKALALKDNGQPIKVAAIPYANIAELCIECLDYENTAGSTLTAMAVPEGEGEGTFASLLKQVKPDSRHFPRNLIQEHRRAVTLGASVLVGLLALLTTGIVSLGRFIFSHLPL
jgi:hypothetical protein